MRFWTPSAHSGLHPTRNLASRSALAQLGAGEAHVNPENELISPSNQSREICPLRRTVQSLFRRRTG